MSTKLANYHMWKSTLPLALAWLVMTWLCCALGNVQAQAPEAAAGVAQAADAFESRATAFRAVQGPTTEDVPGGPLLLAAYATVWLLLLSFVWRVARLQRQTQRELQALGQQIKAATGQAPAAEDAG